MVASTYFDSLLYLDDCQGNREETTMVVEAPLEREDPVPDSMLCFRLHRHENGAPAQGSCCPLTMDGQWETNK